VIYEDCLKSLPLPSVIYTASLHDSVNFKRCR